MSATFIPYLEGQLDHATADTDAYIRVRVPSGPRPDGSILVYLPNGTALIVNGNQLLHLEAASNCPGESDGRPSTAVATYGHGRRTPRERLDA